MYLTQARRRVIQAVVIRVIRLEKKTWSQQSD